MSAEIIRLQKEKRDAYQAHIRVIKDLIKAGVKMSIRKRADDNENIARLKTEEAAAYDRFRRAEAALWSEEQGGEYRPDMTREQIEEDILFTTALPRNRPL